MGETALPTRRGISRTIYPEWFAGLAVVAGALLLFSTGWRTSLSNTFFDFQGGVSTVGASRVLSGEIPYRDFWTMYAPGQFYLLALLFRIFGQQLWIEVIAASVICALSAYMCYIFTFRLVKIRSTGFLTAAVFSLAMVNFGYITRLGSYPTATLLILLTLYLLLRYYQSQKMIFLLGAGATTGLLIVFKHDVGLYTLLSILAGISSYHFVNVLLEKNNGASLFAKLFVYSIPCLVIVLPVLVYFVKMAGKPMLEDLVLFPLGDFRYARPEIYPSILPFGIYNPSPLFFLINVAKYFLFALPFVFFMLGLVAIGIAYKERKAEIIALGVTFTVAYLLHYEAAHIQTNTHIITMSVYGAFSAVVFYALVLHQKVSRFKLGAVLGGMVAIGWIFALSVNPVYMIRMNKGVRTATINLPRASGFRVTPEQAQVWEGMTLYMQSKTRPDEKIYVGLHRHDVIVVGDIFIYFLLDRPIATRYHELHPAITDTKPVQQEIISELQKEQVSLIILKHIFPDDVLERVKTDFLQHLPYIGSTDLDEYIWGNFKMDRTFGPYEVWVRVN